ncbi:MAG: hypothetical protein PUP92_34630 [Rhizonema sp. PD38]|nr:hypothetical protein [Rhizonema sp. PD38]
MYRQDAKEAKKEDREENKGIIEDLFGSDRYGTDLRGRQAP